MKIAQKLLSWEQEQERKKLHQLQNFLPVKKIAEID